MRSVCWLIFALGCGDKPTPTGTSCADPDPLMGTTTLTWDNFGHDFMFAYCTNCHSSDVPRSQRHGATIYHDFDSLFGVYEVIHAETDHVDEQRAGDRRRTNNFMPGAGTDGRCPTVKGGPLDEDCPVPTGEERTNLAVWIACEKRRPHDFVDAGVGSGSASRLQQACEQISQPVGRGVSPEVSNVELGAPGLDNTERVTPLPLRTTSLDEPDQLLQNYVLGGANGNRSTADVEHEPPAQLGTRARRPSSRTRQF